MKHMDKIMRNEFARGMRGPFNQACVDAGEFEGRCGGSGRGRGKASRLHGMRGRGGREGFFNRGEGEGFGEDMRRGGGRGKGRGLGGGFDRGIEGGRGGRRRRLFDQKELQTLLLAFIAETPRHGYDLIREIETLSGGEYAPSPGVVYPALTFMEESGLIAVVEDDSTRKSYAVTDEGQAQVEADAERIATLKSRLESLAAARDKVDPAPVRRAVHALKTAVFDRLSQDGADRDLVLQIADAIDEATRKIERIGA